MSKVLSSRPSASMVVAVLALVVAASGTAAAATKLVIGDSLIKKRSLSGDRLRNHTITGTQINLNRLGIVPSAADAANAGHASIANTATTATTAANANALGGEPASAFEAASNLVHTGLITATPNERVAFASFGPFTLTLACTDNGHGSFTSEIDATSSQPDSDIAGGIVGTPETQTSTGASETNTGQGESGPTVVDFIAPSGQAYQASLVAGTGAFNATCYGIGIVAAS